MRPKGLGRRVRIVQLPERFVRASQRSPTDRELVFCAIFRHTGSELPAIGALTR